MLGLSELNPTKASWGHLKLPAYSSYFTASSFGCSNLINNV